MNRLSSTRFRLAPSPPILISSRACVVTMMLPSGSACGLRPHLLSGPQHGLDDVLVAGAAAEIARQGPPDLVLGRVWVLGQECRRGDHHARRTESALQAVLVLEALLDRMQLARAGQTLYRRDLMPVGLHGEHRAALDWPSVVQHSAGTAVGGVAAGVRTGQGESLAE